MFAGIIERLGKVLAVGPAPGRAGAGGAAMRLIIELGELADGLQEGASVAINGACLTVVERGATAAGFDVVPETWRRTNLRQLKVGDAVILERSLRVGDRIDGHFVQRHVDGTGTVARMARDGGECKLWIEAPPELMPFIVPKGSIALDGTSLTIVDVEQRRFSVALIPLTLSRTTFARRRAGDEVNIETDIIARLIMSRLHAFSAGAAAVAPAEGVTLEQLRAGGYLP